MADKINEPERIAILRTNEEIADKLYKELKEGRLRQGWGAEGMSLLDENGEALSKDKWEQNYKNSRIGWGSPSSRRYSALNKMLKIKDGDVVVLPKMPKSNQLSVCRVSGDYRFGELVDGDFGHIIPVDQNSVRTFNYRSSDDAYEISRLFHRANHRYPVTFAYNKNNIKAAGELLKQPRDNLEEKNEDALVQASLDNALKAAAQAMQEKIKNWNDLQFEQAVRAAFENQGYKVVSGYRRYDGKGADVDLVVEPPINNYSRFMPPQIAVQIKWKQGTDSDDVNAVEQLVKWQESDTVGKFVISSADKFTQVCKDKAEGENITLIGGLHTMYFLMGLPYPVSDA